MNSDSSWAWHKFKIGCVVFMIISVAVYFGCVEVTKAIFQTVSQIVTQPVPLSLPSFYYWIMLVPALVLGIQGSLVVVEFYERQLLGIGVGYGGRRRRRWHR